MILETVVTTLNKDGAAHLAPMGVQLIDDHYVIMPFRPSTTLDNILETRTAIINCIDDVRVFAGCLTGKKDWRLESGVKIKGNYLACALTHIELKLESIQEDSTRPKLFFNIEFTQVHAPFRGFNRAQFSVIEAAILMSRINMLPKEKIEKELDYLSIGLEKTAGPNELEAWSWLMEAKLKHERGID